MKKAVFLVLALAVAVPAAAVVVDFDSFVAPATIPAGYAGFTWDPNFYAYDQANYNSGYANTVTFPSYPNAAYNAYGVSSVFASRSTYFNLVGAYFSTWADSNSFWSEAATSVTVTGYRSGIPLTPVTFSLTTGFVYEALGLNDINYVTFAQSDGYGHWWLMDNMTYNAVPLPPSVLLFGSGLLGLLGFRRFRKN